MEERLKILMLEDSIVDAELVQRLLIKEKLDFEFKLALDKDSFLDALDQFNPSLILADNSVPQFNAREALKIIRQRGADIPFIMVTGTVSEEFAADIIKLGAHDYILKDRMMRLPAAIATALKQQKVEIQNRITQEEIRRSNERFQILSKATKEAIWDWNLITNQIWWNENFFALLGVHPDHPIPHFHEWTRRLHPFDGKKVRSMLIKMKKNSLDSSEDEFRYQLEDGSYGTVLNKTYVLKDDSGKPVRIIGALLDITGQKRLIREMEVLSMVAKETSNSVMIFDSKSGNTIWVNEGFTRHTGFIQNDLHDRNPWLMLAGTETDKNIMNFICGQIENNSPFTCDLLIYNKEAQHKWHFFSGQPIREDNGNTTTYFVISTDITEKRKMEEERLANKIEGQKAVARIILQTQEFERNAIGRELHDNINQILTSVNLKLGYYLEEAEGNTDIIKNCRHTLKMAINETRKLSHRMVMPIFSDKNLKEELELLVGSYSCKKMVQLEFTKMNEKKIPHVIKETLFRIAQEQLSNIIKHAKASKIVMQLSNDSKIVTMDIKDNGIGFDIRQKRKGIGITNILNRVGSYNGTADIISLPGKGCTLFVTIPLAS